MTDKHTPFRVAKYFDPAAVGEVEKARSGDPASLRLVLSNVARFLKGEAAGIPAEIRFVAEALAAFAEADQSWQGAGREFRKIDRSKVTAVESLVHLGPRVSEPTQKRIGRSFCRAFGVSKPPGKLKEGELPNAVLACPIEVYKIESLRWIGMSRADSISVVNSAYPKLTERKLGTWVRRMEINAPAPRDYRFIRNRLSLAARVLRRTSEGASLEQACFDIAEQCAIRLFPALVAKLEWWASKALEDPEGRSSSQLELAHRVIAARETGSKRPQFSSELYAEIVAELALAPRSTFLSEGSIQLIAKAVWKAYKFAAAWRKQDPGWNVTWGRLQRRHSRLGGSFPESTVREQP